MPRGKSTRKSRPVKAARGAAAGRASEAAASYVPVRERVSHLVAELGNNRVADLLGVSRSQPSRWARGGEGIGFASQRLVVDLDYVMARLLRLYRPRQALIWLTSHNAFLGATPADVLRLHGAARVVAALDAEEQGAFA